MNRYCSAGAPSRSNNCGVAAGSPRRDERSASTLGGYESVAREKFHRLSHGDARDDELAHQRLERRQLRARRPPIARDALAEDIRELGVARHRPAEQRRVADDWRAGRAARGRARLIRRYFGRSTST